VFRTYNSSYERPTDFLNEAPPEEREKGNHLISCRKAGTFPVLHKKKVKGLVELNAKGLDISLSLI